MRTIQTTLYEYNELDAKAKARARDWFLEHSAFEPSNVIVEAIEFGRLLGIKAQDVL